jgi:hypothetical protein
VRGNDVTAAAQGEKFDDLGIAGADDENGKSGCDGNKYP